MNSSTMDLGILLARAVPGVNGKLEPDESVIEQEIVKVSVVGTFLGRGSRQIEEDDQPHRALAPENRHTGISTFSLSPAITDLTEDA